MAKAGRKTQEMRHISFRMPADVHLDYVTVAESRGIDLSSLLNWVVVEFRPVLLLRHAEHRAAMLRATIADPDESTGEDTAMTDVLAGINDMIRRLQELTAILRKKLGSVGRRRAA